MSDHATTMPDNAIMAGMVEIERLRRENNRLREALEKMLDPEKAGVATYEIGVMQDIARDALGEEAGDE